MYSYTVFTLLYLVNYYQSAGSVLLPLIPNNWYNRDFRDFPYQIFADMFAMMRGIQRHKRLKIVTKIEQRAVSTGLYFLEMQSVNNVTFVLKTGVMGRGEGGNCL